MKRFFILFIAFFVVTTPHAFAGMVTMSTYRSIQFYVDNHGTGTPILRHIYVRDDAGNGKDYRVVSGGAIIAKGKAKVETTDVEA